MSALAQTIALPQEKSQETVHVALIGCGAMAQYHVKTILPAFPDTTFTVVCEPSPTAYRKLAALFEAAGREPPPNEPDLAALLARYGDQLDAAFIVTPHAFHAEQAEVCLEAGLDVLLEKPMVVTAAEAERLIETQRRTGGHLVVAFQGSLSPQVRAAAALLRSGEAGQLQGISATVWQNWRELSAGTWRQRPDVAGGGFLFDTGAHMLNTVADLAGEDFVEVAAWLSNRGEPVETLGVVIGRLQSGALVTLHGCGDTVPSCTSDIMIFGTRAILRTCIWGRSLSIQRHGETAFEPLAVPLSRGVWEQFLAVRRGEIPNPCPPAVGLRMARLWDAIRASTAQGGAPVRCDGVTV